MFIVHTLKSTLASCTALCVQVPDMQFLFVAVGGGGLVSGLAAAVKATKPGVVVVGCQPAASPVMARR